MSFQSTSDGAAIAFTTDQPQGVAELRWRVHRMSMAYPRTLEGGATALQTRPIRSASSRTNAGTPRPGPGHVRQIATAIPFVENLDNGARLLLWSPDPADVDVVRAYARAKVEALARGICPRASRA